MRNHASVSLPVEVPVPNQSESRLESDRTRLNEDRDRATVTTSRRQRDTSTQVIGYPLLAVFFGSMMILALSVEAFGRFWRFPPLRQVGKYSYGLYVYHYLFGGEILAFFHPGSTARARLPCLWPS